MLSAAFLTSSTASPSIAGSFRWSLAQSTPRAPDTIPPSCEFRWQTFPAAASPTRVQSSERPWRICDHAPGDPPPLQSTCYVAPPHLPAATRPVSRRWSAPPPGSATHFVHRCCRFLQLCLAPTPCGWHRSGPPHTTSRGHSVHPHTPESASPAWHEESPAGSASPETDAAHNYSSNWWSAWAIRKCADRLEPDDRTPPWWRHTDYSGHTPSFLRMADRPPPATRTPHPSIYAGSETLSAALRRALSNMRALPPAKKKFRSHWCAQNHPARGSIGPHDSQPQNERWHADAPAEA